MGLGNKAWKQEYSQLLSLLMTSQAIYDRNFHAYENCKITNHGPQKRHTLVRGNARVPFIYTIFLKTLGFFYPANTKQEGKSLYN